MKDPLEKVNPAIKAMYQDEARRVAQMYGIYKHLKHGNIDTSNIWVGKMLQRAETTALLTILVRKRIIIAEDFLNESIHQLKAMIEATELELGIIITSEGILTREDPPKKSEGSNGGEGSQES